MTPKFLREEAARFRGMAETVDRDASRLRLLAMAADYRVSGQRRRCIDQAECGRGDQRQGWHGDRQGNGRGSLAIARPGCRLRRHLRMSASRFTRCASQVRLESDRRGAMPRNSSVRGVIKLDPDQWRQTRCVLGARHLPLFRVKGASIIRMRPPCHPPRRLPAPGTFMEVSDQPAAVLLANFRLVCPDHGQHHGAVRGACSRTR